jgi:hypothetical protein
MLIFVLKLIPSDLILHNRQFANPGLLFAVDFFDREDPSLYSETVAQFG